MDAEKIKRKQRSKKACKFPLYVRHVVAGTHGELGE
jgi:hypothetical protein